MNSRLRAAWPLIAALAVTLLAAPTARAQAGGLYLPENGGPASGTAMAGQAAIARDAQTAWLNPAGMTRLDTPEIMVSVMPFYLNMQFNKSDDSTIPGNDGGQQGRFLAGAGLFLAAPVSERFAFGFSVTSPAGLVVDPNDDWAGRTWMTESIVIALNFEPSIGFKINDQWSIGAGLDIQYAYLNLKFAFPGPGPTAEIDGDNWELGFSLSLLWQPNEKWRVGLRYRSAMNHELDGDFTIIEGGKDASTGLDFPQNLTLSAYHQVTDSFAVMADLGWTEWSSFTRTVINTAVTDISIPRNWKNTYNVGVGMHIRPAEKWLVMAGFSFVTSPVRDADRTPDLPGDRQFRYSVGLEYEVTDTIRVGGTFTYADIGDNRIDTTRGPGRFAGDYDADIFLLGLYAAFQF